MTDKKEDALALGVSMSAQVGDKRNIVMQTHIAQDQDATPLLVRMNASISVIEDIQALKQYRADVSKHEQDLVRFRENLAVLDSRLTVDVGVGSDRKMRKLTQEQQKELNERENALVNVKRFEAEISRLRREISILEVRIDGSSSTTDCSPCCSDSEGS